MPVLVNGNDEDDDDCDDNHDDNDNDYDAAGREAYGSGSAPPLKCSRQKKGVDHRKTLEYHWGDGIVMTMLWWRDFYKF